MSGATQSCPGNAHADNSNVLYREYEASFLLPQFMGALAGETHGSGRTDRCPRQSGEGLWAKLRASLVQSLKFQSALARHLFSRD